MWPSWLDWLSDMEHISPHDTENFTIWHLLLITSIISSIIILINIIRSLSKELGGKAGKMDTSAVLYLLNPVMYYTVLQKIHEFQHDVSRTLLNIHYGKISLEDPSFREKVRELLFVCGDIAQTLIGRPVSVNIKLFSLKNDDNSSSLFKGKLSEAKLKTFVRAPSKAEYEDCMRNGESRRNIEEFEIVLGADNKPELLKKRYPDKSDAARVNTAYNQVLGPRDHFWVNNNLVEAEKESHFWSNSLDWRKYYKSMAVFIIAQNIPQGEPVGKTHRAMGILIFDSPATGRFSRRLAAIVLGYLAHRLHSVFRQAAKIPSDSIETKE